MTSVRPVQIFEDDKTYPILVKVGGGYRIIEMGGDVVNLHNGTVDEKKKYVQRMSVIMDNTNSFISFNKEYFKWGTFSGLEFCAEMNQMIEKTIQELKERNLI